MNNNICVLKLITGEEIVGTVDTSNPYALNTNSAIKLTKVRTLVMVQTGPQQMGIDMIPYSVSCVDGVIEIKSHAIAGTPEGISKTLEDAYLSQTSGIQLANVGNITT